MPDSAWDEVYSTGMNDAYHAYADQRQRDLALWLDVADRYVDRRLSEIAVKDAGEDVLQASIERILAE